MVIDSDNVYFSHMAEVLHILLLELGVPRLYSNTPKSRYSDILIIVLSAIDAALGQLAAWFAKGFRESRSKIDGQRRCTCRFDSIFRPKKNRPTGHQHYGRDH